MTAVGPPTMIGIALGGREIHAFRAGAYGNVHWNRLLHGLRQHVQIFNVDERAFEGQGLVFPASVNYIDVFGGSAPAPR